MRLRQSDSLPARLSLPRPACPLPPVAVSGNTIHGLPEPRFHSWKRWLKACGVGTVVGLFCTHKAGSRGTTCLGVRPLATAAGQMLQCHCTTGPMKAVMTVPADIRREKKPTATQQASVVTRQTRNVRYGSTPMPSGRRHHGPRHHRLHMVKRTPKTEQDIECMSRRPRARWSGGVSRRASHQAPLPVRTD